MSSVAHIADSMAEWVYNIASDAGIEKNRLKQFLQERYYPESFITAYIVKAKLLLLYELLKADERNTELENLWKIPFVTLINLTNVNIFSIAQKNSPILGQSDPMRYLISKTNIVISKRLPADALLFTV